MTLLKQLVAIWRGPWFLPAVLLLSLGAYGQVMKQRGKLEAEVAALKAQLADARRTVTIRDQAAVAAAADYETELARWQAAKQRVRTVYRRSVVRDTLLQHDTVQVAGDFRTPADSFSVPYLEVESLMEQADSTINACHLLVTTCAAQVAALRDVVQLQDQQIRAVQRQRPSRVRGLTEKLVFGIIGYGIGRYIPH